MVNGSRPFLGIFVLGMLIYALSIGVSSDPLTRINRACAPVNWTRDGVTAGIKLTKPDWLDPSERWFDARFSDCRLLVWEAFYEREFAEQSRRQRASATSQVHSEVDAWPAALIGARSMVL